MNVINIGPVRSGQSKSVIGIAGKSGDGKTLTALYIARGMVDHPSEIGFLDTENKRGSLYADALDGPFMIGDLYPPFSPARYAAAIRQFQDSGVKVLVIDSVTHEWEGEGGCDDIANSLNAKGEVRKVANWIGAKREHKVFMNVLLQSNMDIICCIRARDKVKVESVNGKQEFVDQGLQPVCEKNFMFEMTVSFMMLNEGKNQKHLKMPNFLKDAFGDGNGYLGIETGKKIRQWLNKGEKESPEIEKIKSEALLACERGTVALTQVWDKCTPEQQEKLKGHFAVCKTSAKAYDKINADNSQVDENNVIEDDYTKEQKRIKVFIEKATTQEELDSLENVDLSKENFDALSDKRKIITDGQS